MLIHGIQKMFGTKLCFQEKELLGPTKNAYMSDLRNSNESPNHHVDLLTLSCGSLRSSFISALGGFCHQGPTSNLGNGYTLFRQLVSISKVSDHLLWGVSLGVWFVSSKSTLEPQGLERAG